MRDFPLFPTEYGVASLALKEVPYRQAAYITIQSALQPEELLKECISFCRMVGAERIYARGHECLEAYPLHASIYEMRGCIDLDESKVEQLWPVTEETAARWREQLNTQLRQIDHAATLEKKDEKEIVKSGGAYFVHRAGELLGVGLMNAGELKMIAATQRGAGQRVFHTLLSANPVEQLRLEVVSTNSRAIGFYEKLGFVKTGEICRWHQVY